MSIEVLNWAWRQDVPSASAKLVLLAIADHANGDGYCWPSMKRIAGMTGLSVRQVSNHVTKLAELGLLVKADRRRSGGQYRGWSYVVGDTSGSGLPVEGATSGSDLPLTSGSGLPVTSGSELPHGTTSENRQRTTTSPRAARARDELFEKVVGVCGHDVASLTKSERGRINRAVKEIREAGGTPERVDDAVRAWRQRYPDAVLTPTALSAHWSTLAAGVPRRTARPQPELIAEPEEPRKWNPPPPDVLEKLGRKPK